MNKAELVAALAQAQGITKTQAGQNVDALLAVVSAELASGKTVQLIGFGSFNVVNTKARKGRNPRTGEVLKIAAAKKVRFNISSKLRSDVNIKKVVKAVKVSKGPAAAVAKVSSKKSK